MVLNSNYIKLIWKCHKLTTTNTITIVRRSWALRPLFIYIIQSDAMLLVVFRFSSRWWWTLIKKLSDWFDNLQINFIYFDNVWISYQNFMLFLRTSCKFACTHLNVALKTLAYLSSVRKKCVFYSSRNESLTCHNNNPNHFQFWWHSVAFGRFDVVSVRLPYSRL